MNKSVSFLAVGPQRTASSWLDRALRSNPELSLPANVKETFFFDEHFSRGFEWYFGLFDQPRDGVISGEVGSTYFDSADVRQRIQEHNPNARIIIMVRNPVSRAFSSFGHEFAKGRVNDSFFDAVENKPHIIQSGRYSIHAPAWESTFGDQNVLYLVQEDIEADPQSQMNKVCRFLGTEPVPLEAELQKRYGQGTVPRSPKLAAMAARTASTLRAAGLHRVVEAGKRLGLKKVYSGGSADTLALSRSILDFLLKEYEPDIAFLEERLGRRFPHWRDPETYQVQ